MKSSAFLARLRFELHELLVALRGPRFYLTLGLMAVGIVLGSVAVNGILIPRNLFAPGISGIALLWFYLLHWPSLGVIYGLLNVPLFLIGWREYALKYVVISILGVLMYSTALILTEGVVIPAPDPLMASIMAGVMMGFGSGLYLRMGGSAGGLDILATYIKKKIAVPMGTTLNAVNAIALIGAWLIYDLEVAFYSGVFMFVNSWTLERVLTGFSQRRAVLIISDYPEAVAEQVMKRLDRGVTFFHATGGYSNAPERVVYSVINLYELGRLKDLLFELDPKAFVVIYNTSEVIGERFLTWEEQGYRPGRIRSPLLPRPRDPAP
jgi:uncharacterized membrane-anchored protein YitT (DUF2179 family)